MVIVLGFKGSCLGFWVRGIGSWVTVMGYGLGSVQGLWSGFGLGVRSTYTV